MRHRSLVLRHVLLAMFCGTLIIASLQKHPSRHAAEDELFAAAQSGDVQQVAQALDDDARINVRDVIGMTPLMISAFAARKSAVELLLRRGADVDVCCDAGSALGLAAFEDHQEIVDVLLRHGARVEIHGGRAATPLGYAVMAKDSQVIRMLLEAHANVNAKSYDGTTPLMIAADYGGMEEGILLLASGADPDCRDLRGNTADSIALKSGHPEFVALLARARIARRGAKAVPALY